MRAFSLSKSYVDCVSAEGRVFVAYAIDLSWGPVHLKYNASLSSDLTGPIRTQSTTLGFSAPLLRGDTLVWTSQKLGFEGRWTRQEPAMATRVYASESGSIHWDCPMPGASAEVRLKSGRTLEGLGFVERVDLSIAPWEIPFRIVRGGHFLSEEQSVVWMDWTGQTPMQFARIGGAPATILSASDTAVGFEGAVLELGRSRILREGYLADTVFRAIPEVQSLVPQSILDIEDRKFLSAAVLRRPGFSDITGWAVHEVTIWPEARA